MSDRGDEAEEVLGMENIDEEALLNSDEIPLETAEQDPLSECSNTKQKKARANVPLWREVRDENTALDTPIFLGNQELSFTEDQSPIEIFRFFFSDDLIEHIVFQTNLYNTQKSPRKSLDLNTDEFEKFLGILLAMSMVKLSNSRLYWSSKLNCPLVSEAMSRDRWEEIKSNLHINDNSKNVPRGHPGYDPLFKIRPMITDLVTKCKQLPMLQTLSIDEQIVPFKGISALKQYLPNKPHKWGYKIYCLCSTDGMLHNFFIYTGKICPVDGQPDLGASSNAVLHLTTNCVPSGKNHLIYFDNWFTSISLMTTLAKNQIYALGTVRLNRVPGVTFLSDKEMKKRDVAHFKKSVL